MKIHLGDIDTFAHSIQTMEGYYPGSVAYRNNNPGNLMYAGQPGATGADGSGFAVFPSYGAGYQALVNQINLDASRGLTIEQMMNKYAPAGHGGNDPAAYAAFVADANGVSVDTLVRDALAGAGGAGNGNAGDGMDTDSLLALGAAAVIVWLAIS